MSATPGPLAGVKVLEFGTLIAGPFAARLFAEFGADVIKVEDPNGGDPLRKWRKLYPEAGGTSLWWAVQARNKKSVTLNLKTDEGRRIAQQLASQADIVIENFRPGLLEKLGLGYEVLSADNPGLVMVRLSGYGQSGPYRDRPGFGAIAESMGGLRHITGYPELPPPRIGISIGDSIAALHGVIGAMMALHHRNMNGGKGQVVDVALYEAVFNMMESVVPEYGVYGMVRERTGASLPGIVPSNTYACADGSIVIGGNSDPIFKRLMKAIERADLADDPALAHNDGRVPRTREIDEAIAAWLAPRTIEAALAVLNAADVPAGRIYSVADMFSDPQFVARQMIQRFRLPDGQEIPLPNITPKLSDTPGDTRWLGPALGEHTDEVLGGLGYEAAAIAALRERRVI
ncbi:MULTISPECIES: CaiB/BaiF CoA transferase family protein [Burkholderia]|jgi:formyl-CoA transferase|uniref:CoA-transferase III family protein n=1 Tax=Burkholderia gladioli TaxID=28095 RepID=A0AAP8S1N7_BURGA|nr:MULTISPECIES: CaiB/BaiF CoA-transferase family protein [Burkholderia]AJX01028.1 coA-transferase III family protein [Burkholderia gladioli]ASD79532.1 CoA transferase [Burkholderia gladioli pv. gladioli]AWY55225.1 CoA transferase [Burkholderia gladioli pv. gladioli]AYQ88561.1 CoA transferase [Burkholderia gladioli]KAF1062095.1 Succinyl-CoA--L-malate CoA-transferase beta subunit [Burkholderia gladioli]